jgi:hypothetical protein
MLRSVIVAVLCLLPSVAQAQLFAPRFDAAGNQVGLRGRLGGTHVAAFAGGCTSSQASAQHIYHHVVQEQHVVHQYKLNGCNGGTANAAYYSRGGCTSSQAGGYYNPGTSRGVVNYAPPMYKSPPVVAPVTPEVKSGSGKSTTFTGSVGKQIVLRREWSSQEWITLI